MTTLHIEHAITDFSAWQAAFSTFAKARGDGGVRAYTVRQPIDDPHYIVVDLEFDQPESAEKFSAFLRTKVWSTPQNSPALVGSPMLRILEERAAG